jgi:AraC-like DNA-binding protein
MCVRLDDANLRVEAGEVVLIPAGAPHEELGLRGEPYACVWATADPYMSYMHISGKESSGGFYSREAVSAGPDTGFDVAFGQLASLIESTARHRDALMKTHLLQFCVGILDALEAADPTEDDLPSEHHPSLVVVKVLNYIKRNHTRRIRLSDIADEVCVSPGHLNALFKKERGHTIMQTLEAHRISVAKKLLTYTENSIEEIADHLAFCDQFHFSKTFKKRTGLSPAQFRKR